MSGNWDSLARIIRRHIPATATSESDTDLLARFLVDGDEIAFEELVRRYGALVYGVCRRGLPSADADDAFQATFLSLVTRVRKVGPIEGVGGWLYRAATHVVADNRRTQQRRRARESAAARPEAAPSTVSTDNAELLSVLDEEIARLPDRYRQALVHYHVLNQPLSTAAHALGVSVAVVWKRVHKAEAILRQRLARRGLVVPATGLFGALATCRDAAAAPADVVQAVVRSAAAPPAATGPVATTLTKAPGSSRLISVMALGALAGVTCGAGLWIAALRDELPPALPQPPSPSVAAAGPSPPQPARLTPWTVLIGRVVDLAGDGVPHARLSVLGRAWDHVGAGQRDDLLADATTDAEGRFRIPVLTPPRGGNEGIWLVTFEPKRGRTVTSVPVATGLPPAELTVRLNGAGFAGRVVDPHGTPLAGATVTVARFGGAAFEALRPEHKLPDVWPAPVTTDATGRFVFPTLDPTVGLRLNAVHQPSGTSAVHEVRAAPAVPNGDVVVRLEANRRLNGRVVAADTGLPLAAELALEIGPDDPSGKVEVVRAWAGPDGRFAVAAPTRPLWRLLIIPFGGSSYPRVQRWVEPNAGAEPIEVTVPVPKGVAVRGKVTDATTGRPVPLSKVRFYSELPITPPAKKSGELWAVTGPPTGVTTDQSGRFSIAVPSVRGALTVHAPGSDYLTTELDPGGPDGNMLSAHAVAPSSAWNDGSELALRLEQGRTIHARIRLPDGAAAPDGTALCVHLVNGRGRPVPRPLSFQDGKLTIPGCHEGRVYTLIVTDRTGRHGATARVAWAEHPATIPLQPLGEAAIEVRTNNDGPVFRVPFTLDVGIPVGPDSDGPESGGVRWCRVASGRPTSDSGRVLLKGLVPGARYRVSAGPTNRSGVTVVTVRPGERRAATVVLPEPEDD